MRLQGSGGELSAEEDEEWHGDDGEEETVDAAAEEDEAWEQRRQKKPISPVRTRGTPIPSPILFLSRKEFTKE